MASAALILFTLAAVFHGTTTAAIVKYTLNITYGFYAPDCSTKAMYLINGQYPGPHIVATYGDTLQITLNNQLFTDGIVMHWHGIKQTNTTFMDGVPGLTQCPIIAGESFVYEFPVDQVGTFWYHSHYFAQKANGMYGLMILHPSNITAEKEMLAYDEELTPTSLNDWWHSAQVNQELGLGQVPYIWPGLPQSLLINGRGVYNCSLKSATDPLVCNQTSTQCGYPVFTVTSGVRYRVRIVNVGALAYMSYNIEGHNFTVVAADGAYTEPIDMQHLDINGGQAYSIVFTADQPVGNYWINVHMRYKASGPVGVAILRYVGAANTYPSSAIPTNFPKYNDTVYSVSLARSIVMRNGYNHTIPAPTREIILVGSQGFINGNLKWSVNNNTYVNEGTPLLLEQYYGLNKIVDDGSYDKPQTVWNYSRPLVSEGISTEAKQHSIVYKTKLNAVIQIIFQNTLTIDANASEQHPWHLHGHDAFVIGYGDGTYDPVESPKTFNLVNPIERNTYTIFPNGWLAIRYVAKNPGLWLLHCHLLWHAAMGMEVAIYQGDKDTLPPLPRNFPICGDVTLDVVQKSKLRMTTTTSLTEKSSS